jgi:hypothetical protein
MLAKTAKAKGVSKEELEKPVPDDYYGDSDGDDDKGKK